MLLTLVTVTSHYISYDDKETALSLLFVVICNKAEQKNKAIPFPNPFLWIPA